MVDRSLHFYRDGIAFLSPLVPNYTVIDARVCTYLEDYASNRLKGKAQELDDRKSRDFFASIGFILAALAAGSQCSAVKCPWRRNTTQDFGEFVEMIHLYWSSNEISPQSISLLTHEQFLIAAYLDNSADLFTDYRCPTK